MFFQGRGNVYLAVRDPVTGVAGPYKIVLCTDSLALALSTTPFSHINKCGPADVVDYTGIKDQSGSLNLTTADVDDNKFALGTLGTVTAAGGTGTISGEELPTNIDVGDVYFLGGDLGHQAITALTVSGLVLNTDYTFDPVLGKLTFLTAVSGSPTPPTAGYGYTDVQKVSLFTSPTQEYAFKYEYINKANANKPGLFALYRVKFDPIKNLDLQSDELQIMDLSGSALADLTKPLDDVEFGRFGYRIL